MLISPCLTSPQIVVRHTIFTTATNRLLVSPDDVDEAAKRYQGYFFERVFVLCCDVHGKCTFWNRIVNCDEDVANIQEMAAVPGWKYVAWTPKLRYHAEPAEGPDFKLAQCDVGALLVERMRTYKPLGRSESRLAHDASERRVDVFDDDATQ